MARIKKGPRPLGSIVKSQIEEAIITATELEDEIAGTLAADIGSLENRMALVGEMARTVARLSYFTRETIELCQSSPIEAEGQAVEIAMNEVQLHYVTSIRAENSAQFARSMGQMLISMSTLRSKLGKLETARFENSNMRRA